MSHENKDEDEITEKIKIIATDDEKIKSFGELLTNDSSRAILQLLFNEELTALQIAEKTGISLQLVKYHIIKLQDLGVVKVTKIDKNSKSQDMKFYTASKFSMVIVPPKYSEKTKESKLLVRSFRHIYKIAGFGVSAGISGLMSLTLLQQESRTKIGLEDSQKAISADIQDGDSSFQTTLEGPTPEMSAKISQSPNPSAEIVPEPPQEYSSQESIDVSQKIIEDSQGTTEPISKILGFDVGDLAITCIILSVILGGFAAFYFYKSIKQSKQNQFV